jgi:hypothetical protein
MNTNLFHNIANILIALIGAMAAMDWTVIVSQQTATGIVSGLAALKIVINVVRDGVTGLAAPQPPVIK